MIARLVAILTLLTLFGCAPPATLPNRLPRTTVVAIVNDDGQAICSAFAVTTQVLATAAHCLDSDEVQLVTRDKWFEVVKERVTAQVIHVDDDRDLALLVSPLTFKQPNTIRPPEVDEPVIAVAAPFLWRESRGRVVAQCTTEGFYNSSISIQPGWSGSPVFGMDGKVVGVISKCFGITVRGERRCAPGLSTFAAFQ